jgi:hypothetical protein
MFIFQTQKYGPQAIHEAKRRFYMMQQDKHTSVQEYYESFANTVEVIEHCGGDIGVDRSLVTEMLGGHERAVASSAELIVNAEQMAKDKYMACAFILGVDKTCYGKLMEDLENAYTQGDDEFPKTMTDTYNLLVNWKQNPCWNYMRVIDSTKDGAMFVNDGSEGKPTDTTFAGKCWICKQTGHRKSECPARNDGDVDGKQPMTGTQMLLETGMDDTTKTADEFHFMFHMIDREFMFCQGSSNALHDWILLLDNQSTASPMCSLWPECQSALPSHSTIMTGLSFTNPMAANITLRRVIKGCSILTLPCKINAI